MLAIGVPAIRLLAVAYLLSIINLVIAAALQGLSLGTKSMYLTMLRQALLPLIFALAASSFGNLNMVWMSFIIAEFLGMPLAFLLWKKSTAMVFARGIFIP